MLLDDSRVSLLVSQRLLFLIRFVNRAVLS